MSKCETCNGKGWYIGIVPPGREVKCKCFCGGRKPKAKLYPHQLDIVKKFTHYHPETGELKLVEPCGSGKLFRVSWMFGDSIMAYRTLQLPPMVRL